MRQAHAPTGYDEGPGIVPGPSRRLMVHIPWGEGGDAPRPRMFYLMTIAAGVLPTKWTSGSYIPSAETGGTVKVPRVTARALKL